MAADLNAIKEDYRLRAEFAVGATSAAPKYEAQITWLKDAFQGKFDDSTGGDGAKFTNSNFEGGSATAIYPGATDQEVATAIRLLIRELQQLLGTATATTSPRGMRWSARACES